MGVAQVIGVFCNEVHTLKGKKWAFYLTKGS